jgi:cob(I)alamin adenosyltransferase
MKKIHLGDKGTTRVFEKQILKSECSIEVLGNLDELNSYIGLCRCFNRNKLIGRILEKVQKDLFLIGSEISYCVSGKKSKSLIKKDMLNFLEQKIKEIERQLPKLNRFILPNGTELASFLHVARAVCRRAERSIVKLSKEVKLNENIIPYINRLSDLLFCLARLANKISGVYEIEWKNE